MSGPLLYTKGNQSQGRVLGYKKDPSFEGFLVKQGVLVEL